MLIKWTKSRQSQATFALISLPTMEDHYMCPVQAWKHYCDMYPKYTKNNMNPLLADPTNPGQQLTVSQTRVHLAMVCHMAHLTTFRYTPHSFRWGGGGAAFLFKQGIPIQEIQHHGLWASSAVELYLRENFPSTSPVVRCFQEAIE